MVETLIHVLVAQLDRASACGAEGRRFKSCQGRQITRMQVRHVIRHGAPLYDGAIPAEGIIVENSNPKHPARNDRAVGRANNK